MDYCGGAGVRFRLCAPSSRALTWTTHQVATKKQRHHRAVKIPFAGRSCCNGVPEAHVNIIPETASCCRFHKGSAQNGNPTIWIL
jgi:hypothetical protein